MFFTKTTFVYLLMSSLVETSKIHYIKKVNNSYKLYHKAQCLLVHNIIDVYTIKKTHRAEKSSENIFELIFNLI